MLENGTKITISTEQWAEFGPGSEVPGVGEFADRLGGFLLFGALMRFTQPVFGKGGGAPHGHGRHHRFYHHSGLRLR